MIKMDPHKTNVRNVCENICPNHVIYFFARHSDAIDMIDPIINNGTKPSALINS